MKLAGVKNSREIMEILAAYDLTGSSRAAGELARVDHHTVKRYVQLGEVGERPAERQHRARPIDEFMDKIEELVAASKGVKSRMRSGHHRVYRPWITEPAL